MACRIGLKPVSAPDCQFNLLGWHRPLFYQSMRQHGNRVSVKEIQDAMMDTLKTDS
jgi:hypothetical protein